MRSLTAVVFQGLVLKPCHSLGRIIVRTSWILTCNRRYYSGIGYFFCFLIYPFTAFIFRYAPFLKLVLSHISGSHENHSWLILFVSLHPWLLQFVNNLFEFLSSSLWWTVATVLSQPTERQSLLGHIYPLSPYRIYSINTWLYETALHNNNEKYKEIDHKYAIPT